MADPSPASASFSPAPPAPTAHPGAALPSQTGDLTALLCTLSDGQSLAAERLLPAVYAQLRQLAEACLRSERRDHTLQPTALVHEAYLKLIDQRCGTWKNRAHFFGVAAQAMRRILVDHARTRRRQKRGGGQRITLSEGACAAPGRTIDLIALDEALDALSRSEPVNARIVEMRFFGGLTEREIAQVLDITDRTVRRRWNHARAWLFQQVSKGDPEANHIHGEKGAPW